jgi:uncharacterized phage-associated protein
MSESAPYDARAVANLLLEFGRVRGLPLTQIAILKILYFAHGWYLAVYDAPLIIQDFEAWKYGPVVKVVRDAFKSFSAEPITELATKIDILTGKQMPIEANITLDDENFIQSIFDAYHVYDVWELSGMTHEPGSPWDQLWNPSAPTGRLALRIRNEDIREYFNRLPRRFRLS